MAYIGQPLNAGNLAVQTGTGDNTTTPIGSLNYSVGSSESLQVTLDGVDQIPGTDFTASGTSISFTSAVPTGVAIKIRFLALPISLPTPGDGTVDETKLKDALIGDFTDATVTASDTFLHGDATDSGNTKRDTIQGILDLVTSDPTRNFIIDGDFQEWPTGTAQVSNPSAGQYVPALFTLQGAHGATYNWDQETSILPTVAESGHNSTACLKISLSGTEDPVTNTSYYYNLKHHITGTTYRQLHGQTVTLSFWVRSSKTGTYCVSFTNSAKNRSHVKEYTISSANTWERKTVTLDLDTSGTWLFTDADIGLTVRWCLFAGSGMQGTGNQWNAANDAATSSQVNWADTSGATFYLSQVGLYLGSTAPDSFVGEPVATVKDQVEYYVQKLLGGTANQWGYNGSCASSTLAYVFLNFHRTMRKAPTVSFKGTNSNFNVFNNNTNDNCSADPVFDTVGLDTCRCTLTVASGLNISDAASIRVDTTSDYILADARH